MTNEPIVSVVPDVPVVVVPVVVVPVVVAPVVTDVPVVVAPVVVEQKKNDLNIEITSTTKLYDFSIKSLKITPNVSACVEIIISTDKVPIERTVNIDGEDYLNWSTDDDYIYYFVRDNIYKFL
jgi:hypothetical protein